MIFTLVVVIGCCLTGYAFADDKALESEIYYDKNANLEWLAGPDKPTNWYDAKTWVESLIAVAGGGWRMPTMKELKTIYQKRQKCNIKPFFKTTGCWIWSGEIKGSSRDRRPRRRCCEQRFQSRRCRGRCNNPRRRRNSERRFR